MSSFWTQPRVRRLSLIALLVVTGAFIVTDLKSPSRVKASGSDTPIKVSGGSMTFFSSVAWYPQLSQSTAGPFCVIVAAADLSQVTVENYREDKTLVSTIPVGTGNYTLIFRTHTPTEGSSDESASNNGIRLDAFTNSTCGTQSGPTVKLSTLSSDSFFYDTELVPTYFYAGNRRFLSNHSKTKCQDDIDRCERVAELDLYIGGDTTKPISHTYTCKDGSCELSLGAPAEGLTKADEDILKRVHRKPSKDKP